MKFKTLLTIAGLAISSASFASGGNPVDDAANAWEAKALRLQSQIDLHSPMSKNNILGTHNSYNSAEYADDGYVRYVDPQQKHTIKEQLRLGARFIELDVHWYVNASNWRYHLMLCHGQDDHMGCGVSDRFFHEGLQEVREWLESSESNDQVIILYIEDHSNDVHDQMYSQLMDKIGPWIYKSNGCGAIPSTLTKADVLNAGAKVVIQKDGREGVSHCSWHEGLRNTVFTSLGDIDRVWEDRTIIGDLFGGVNPDTDYISASDVKNFFEAGRNIVNLDDMTYDDGRNAAAIWSWNTNEPNNANNAEDCAIMLNNGRWADVGCGDNRIHPYSCNEAGTENWGISSSTGKYSGGESACQAKGSNWHFKTPTNAKYNKAVRDAANAAGQDRVWLAITDAGQEGKWTDPNNTFPVFSQYRELKDGRTGRCMGIAGGNTANGTNVVLWDCVGNADNQKWKYDAANGFLRNKTGKCLDNRGQAYNGGEIVIWDCVDSNNLRFDWVGNSLRNRHNNNIAVDAYGTDNGSNIGQWGYHGGSNQQWYWGN